MQRGSLEAAGSPGTCGMKFQEQMALAPKHLSPPSIGARDGLRQPWDLSLGVFPASQLEGRFDGRSPRSCFLTPAP